VSKVKTSVVLHLQAMIGTGGRPAIFLIFQIKCPHCEIYIVVVCTTRSKEKETQLHLPLLLLRQSEMRIH